VIVVVLSIGREDDNNHHTGGYMLHEKLTVYQESIALAEDLCKEVATWPRGFGYLGDQIKRAMASDVLCIAEVAP